jgi:hypothetical protein
MCRWALTLCPSRTEMEEDSTQHPDPPPPPHRKMSGWGECQDTTSTVGRTDYWQGVSGSSRRLDRKTNLRTRIEKTDISPYIVRRCSR